MRGDRALGIMLVTPGIVFVFFLLIFPVFLSFYLAFFKMQMFNPAAFAGIGNFIDVLGDTRVREAIGRTVYVSLTAGLLSMGIGYLIASWAVKSSKAVGTFVQTLPLVPWVTSMVVSALLWRWVLAGQFGIFNYARTLIGLEPLRPLAEASSALASLIFVLVWRTVGFCVVMLVAALHTVPRELIEASYVDGCNAVQRNWYVVLPFIRTQFLIAAIVVTLSHFNSVDIPLVLTGGGPAGRTNVVSLELYRLAFVYNDFGRAIALAVIVFLLNMFLVVGYMKAARRGLSS